MFTSAHKWRKNKKKESPVKKYQKPDDVGNNLLRVLRQGEFDLLAPHIETVNLAIDEVIYEPNDLVERAYFPCGPTLVSYMVMLDDGRGIETGLIGREGAVGGIVSHGHLPAYCKAIVQFPGEALRIDTARIEEAKLSSPFLHRFFARYSDCLLAQTFQSVACNATHTIEQRAAKWLTAAIDRTGDHHVPLKQDQMASLLGVGRSYVARIIGNLKSRNILESRRGSLVIHDVDGLKGLACNCNDLVRQHFDEVLHGVYPDATNAG